MKDLQFYFVDTKYVKHLYEAEKTKRGFSRVPNIFSNKGGEKDKFFCGILLEIGDKKYVAPVTSYMKQQSNNTLITDKDGRVLSSLRYNFMIPVYDDVIKRNNFSKITDRKYALLLKKEYFFCRTNQDDIRQKAEHTYKQVVAGKDKKLCQNSCDFKLLENALEWYKASVSINDDASSVSVTDKAATPVASTDQKAEGGTRASSALASMVMGAAPMPAAKPTSNAAAAKSEKVNE